MIYLRAPLIGLLFLFSYLCNTPVFAQVEKLDKAERTARKRAPQYHYGYINRPHTLKESTLHVSALYGLSWALYPITQPEVFR